MNPISSVTGGAGYQPWSIQPAGSSAAQSLRAADSAGVLGTGSLGGSNATRGTTDVFSAVTELLQSVGGGVEDDGLLRLLITLMILMAQLDNQQSQLNDGGNALRALGGGNSGGGQTLSIYSSSTTISIQHTQTSIFLSGAFATGGDAVAESGGSLDELA